MPSLGPDNQRQAAELLPEVLQQSCPAAHCRPACAEEAMIATMLEAAAKAMNSPLVVPDLAGVALTTTATEDHPAVHEVGAEAELTAGSSSLLGVMAPAAL